MNKLKKDSSETEEARYWEEPSWKTKTARVIGTAVLTLACVAGFFWLSNYLSSDSEDKSSPPEACDIKGNISQTSGEKIYHMPGDTYYDKTEIDTAAGEKYFCSETEAEDNGWRRSKI